MSENISNQPEMSKFIRPRGKKEEEDIYFERENDQVYECHNGNRNEVVINKDNNLVVEGKKALYTVLLKEATAEGSMWIIPLIKNGNTIYKYKYKLNKNDFEIIRKLAESLGVNVVIS